MSGIDPIYITSSVVIADGLVSLGIRSVPVMMPYSPLSLAVASNSLFQEVQLSRPSLGFMFRNLWISCLGGEVACDIGSSMRLLIFCCNIYVFYLM